MPGTAYVQAGGAVRHIWQAIAAMGPPPAPEDAGPSCTAHRAGCTGKEAPLRAGPPWNKHILQECRQMQEGPPHGAGALLPGCAYEGRGRGARMRSPPSPARMPSAGQRRPALPRTHSAVPSALGGLTSGFGMGPGVPPLPWPLAGTGHSYVHPCPGGRTALGNHPSSILTLRASEMKSSAD